MKEDSIKHGVQIVSLDENLEASTCWEVLLLYKNE